MPRFWRFIRWTALGVGLLIVFATVALAIYVRTESFSRWVREQAVAAINESIRGTVAVDRFSASLPGYLTLYNVVLRHDGEEIVVIPRLEAAFSVWPLVWGRVQIARLNALQPRATLVQDQAGEWNIVEALAPRQAEAEESSAWIVLVQSLGIDRGNVALRLSGAGDKVYRFKDLQLRGDLRIRPAGVIIDVTQVASLLTAPELPDLRLKGALAYQQSAAAPAVVKAKDFWLVSRNSQVKLTGQVNPVDPLRLKAQVVLQKLAASDVARFVPDWPVQRDLSGTIAVDGPLDALSGNVELAAAGAKLAGKFQADMTAELPLYKTDLMLSGFSLRNWLNNQNLAGVASGTAQVSGSGFALPNITAKANLKVRGAQAQGWSLGDMSLGGRLENSVAAIDGELKGKLGGATWSGKIALEERPSYEVRLAVNDLDIQRAIRNRDALDGRLNLRGTVTGAGLSFADMKTRAEIQILPSTLGPVEIKKGVLNAALSDKSIQITRVSLSTTDATLTIAGEVGLDAEIAGKLDYRLHVADVSPWLSLVDRTGSGSLRLAGQAQGSLADLRTEGMAQLSRLRFDGIAIDAGSVKYALQGSQEEIFPRGVVNASLSGVDAGMPLRRIDATAKLMRQPAHSMELQLNAQDAQARKHALSGVVEFLPDAVVARLRQAALGSPVGTWTLVHPATVSHRDDGVLIEQLLLRSAAREISLNGRFGFSGPQDLTLKIDRLALEALAPFLPDEPEITGMLGVEAHVTGTAAAPEISAFARLSDATIAGQAYAGADADLKYRDKLVSLRAAVQQDATHTLSAVGTVPLNLSWHEGWRADPGEQMEFRVQSAGISLAFLNAFSGKAVENIAGEVSLDLLARGSIEQPNIQGTFQLRDGQVKVVPLGVQITEIAVAGRVDSRNVVVREMYAKAKDGEIRGSGSLALKDFDISAVKLSLAAKRWPAIATERYQVQIAGNVAVQGSLQAPRVTGKITVTEGSLRPDLAFLEQGKAPLKRDETIVVIKNNRVIRPAPEKDGKPPVPAKGAVFENVSLELSVNAPGNLWIRHPDLVAELSGNVQVRKMPERQLDLTGRIEIVRGWMAFQGRRFQLVRGVIEFTGGDKIAPALDIVAQYRVQDYSVQVLISGTVEKPTLALASEPRLEQADILSLLIFGKPLNALNQNEQGSLQQSALSLTSGFVAASVAKSVSQALGLDRLGLDISDVDFAGGRIGFGRYVGPGTYVSVSQQLSGEQGREVSIEYQIAPDWKISTSNTTTGSSGIDIIWHKRY